MKDKIPFLFGVLFFSATLGFLISASNSPVAGVAISSVFGIGVALIGLFTDKTGSALNRLNTIGSGLVAMSVGLSAGMFGGLEFKNTDHTSEEGRKVLWTPENRPASTYEAMDWILTNDLLIDRGFTRAQVLDLYAIRTAETLDTSTYASYDDPRVYEKSEPYYKMIMEGYDDRFNRTIASSGMSDKEVGS